MNEITVIPRLTSAIVPRLKTTQVEVQLKKQKLISDKISSKYNEHILLYLENVLNKFNISKRMFL